MEKLYFNVFIGKRNQQQSPNIACTVIPHHIPQGDCNVNGEYKVSSVQYFTTLDILGMYFADWLDIVSKENIEIELFFGDKLTSKRIKGTDILSTIDFIEKNHISSIAELSKQKEKL